MTEEEDDMLRDQVRERYARNPAYLEMLAQAIQQRTGENVTVESLKAEYGLP